MEILRCQGLEKTYGSGEGRVQALRQVDLTLEKGAFAALIGPSGSGKSTLLHIIGGVETPTGGKVFVDGEEVSLLNAREAALFRRRKVGLVYQFYNLLPTLSLRQNILMPLLLDRRKPDDAYFQELVETLGLTDKLDALPHQLSGGQQQRGAMARSLLYRPAILLADEPTGNLDRQNSREIIDLIKLSNRAWNQTVLLVTHDEAVAAEADRVLTMEDGRITGDKAREQA